MSGRKCGNCRHYEPSPIWRSGWCRNPRLYGPQESHLVRQDEMACAHRIGNYWEAVEDDEALEPREKPGPGPLSGIVKPLRLFGAGPRLVAATSGPAGGGRFEPGAGGASGGGGAGGSGSLSSSGSGRDAYGGGGSGGGGRPPQGGMGGPGRPDRTGRLPGQERSVSYQPEERYWTDYLRIALPVVGLLLMLGLFWFWAANLINDDDDDEPPASVVAINASPPVTPTTVAAAGGETPATAPTETPVPAEDEAETPPPDAAEDETPPPDDAAEETQPADDAEDEEPPPDDGEDQPAGDSPFAVGAEVIVNTDNLNFRPEPNTDNEPIRQLANGEELEVTGPVETDDDGQDWLPVVDGDGAAGYVAVEFVDPA